MLKQLANSMEHIHFWEGDIHRTGQGWNQSVVTYSNEVTVGHDPNQIESIPCFKIHCGVIFISMP